MTASTTPCCGASPKRLRQLWLLAALCLLAAFSAGAASVIPTERFVVLTQGNDVLVEADFRLQATPRIDETLREGFTLPFAVEIEFTRPRWRFFSETAVSLRRDLQLSYHALTRRYRITERDHQSSYADLGEALSALGHLRAWRIGTRGDFKADEVYTARIRFRLEYELLPRPFQIDTFATGEWDLQTGWRQTAVVVNAGGGRR